MSASLSLAEFYARVYAPTYLVDARPATLEQYSAAVRHWSRVVGGGALRKIDVAALARFKATLLADGLKAATVNKHLRLVQAMLNKAGPAGPRNRDALGVLKRTPWVKPVRVAAVLPREVAASDIDAIYGACCYALYPRVAGIAAASWWRALLVLACTTGFRKGALLSLRWEWIDLAKAVVRVPAESDKAWRERRKPLHGLAVEHLLRIRRAEGLVFPFGASSKAFYGTWHRIQWKAGLARAVHYKLHDMKRFAGTAAASVGSAFAVAQLLDHSSVSTSRFYVNAAEELRGVVNRLVLPAAFAGGGGDVTLAKECG